MPPYASAASRTRLGSKLAVRAAVTIALGVGLVAGCGSRGPLDGTPVVVDAGMDATVDAGPPDTGVDAGPIDAGADTGPNPIDCASCVATQCGPLILTCLQDPSCQQILTCAATQCLGGGGGGGAGGFDPVCLLQCASGQGKGTGEALVVVQCLTQTCSDKCGDILGGLGGFGGSGGGGSGGAGGKLVPSQGAMTPARREQLRQIFSPWPELSSSFDDR